MKRIIGKKIYRVICQDHGIYDLTRIAFWNFEQDHKKVYPDCKGHFKYEITEWKPKEYCHQDAKPGFDSE